MTKCTFSKSVLLQFLLRAVISKHQVNFMSSVELKVLLEKTALKSFLPQRRDILPARKEALRDDVTNIVNTFGRQRRDFNKEKKSAGPVAAE